jgi:hypothetical protein
MLSDLDPMRLHVEAEFTAAGGRSSPRTTHRGSSAVTFPGQTALGVIRRYRHDAPRSAGVS